MLAKSIEDLYEEGKLEGKLEGKVEGKLEIVRKMLFEGLEIETPSFNKW